MKSPDPLAHKLREDSGTATLSLVVSIVLRIAPGRVDAQQLILTN